VIEQAIRHEVKMFPIQALRELLATVEAFQLPAPDFRISVMGVPASA
jgi:hypothetical protein